MIPFFRAFLVAFFTDTLAFRRWMRGLLAAAVPILLQVMLDKSWPTWTAREWVIRSIPSVLAFAHGSMQSSAKKPRGTAIEPKP